MTNLIIVVKTLDNKEILVNEDQVVAVEVSINDNAIIYLSNGMKIECLSPTYSQWRNDVLLRQ